MRRRLLKEVIIEMFPIMDIRYQLDAVLCIREAAEAYKTQLT
jgi:hypothetical protein